MKCLDKLTNAHIHLTTHCRKSGTKAVLKVYYYGEQNGVVRTIISPRILEEETFYDKETLED